MKNFVSDFFRIVSFMLVFVGHYLFLLAGLSFTILLILFMFSVSDIVLYSSDPFVLGVLSTPVYLIFSGFASYVIAIFLLEFV